MTYYYHGLLRAATDPPAFKFTFHTRSNTQTRYKLFRPHATLILLSPTITPQPHQSSMHHPNLPHISPPLPKALKRIKRDQLRPTLKQHIALNRPRQPRKCHVTRMSSRWDAEDVVEFFERTLLGLREEEEDYGEGEHVETGVETKC